MAETKKRNTSGGRNSSAKRSTSARNTSSGRKRTSSGKRGSNKSGSRKNAAGPDLLTIVVVIVAVILVAILIINYNKEKAENREPDVKPTAVLTKAPSENTVTSVPEPTKQPEVTKAPTKAPEPTKEPEITEPVPTEDPVLPREEAKALLEAKLNKELYKTELLSDDLPIEGKSYYLFCIDDLNGNTYEPLVIVEKKNGFLYYYDPLSGTITDFSVFPPDETEKQGSGEQTVSGERAVEILKKYSAAQLGLAKELENYEIEVDDWSSIVKSKECYGINVFEVSGGKTRLRGTFYVSYDGKNVFKQDTETNEFVEIK